ncbi:Kelch-type beta propeller [Pelomyxa schiedti]|nr:Kelch-type beta propeller [Pelomyxa schiedti]
MPPAPKEGHSGVVAHGTSVVFFGGSVDSAPQSGSPAAAVDSLATSLLMGSSSSATAIQPQPCAALDACYLVCCCTHNCRCRVCGTTSLGPPATANATGRGATESATANSGVTVEGTGICGECGGPSVKWLPVGSQTMGFHANPRTHHTAVCFRDCMYVFGGSQEVPASKPKGFFSSFGYSTPQLPQQLYFNNIWCFNFANHMWSEMSTMGISPDARDGHSAVVHAEHMWIFGGSNDTIVMNDLQSYNFGSRLWINHDDTANGAPPSPRRLHSAVVHEDPNAGASMYIFGGYNGRNAFGDLYRYHFDSNSWSVVTATGDIPSARYGHSAVAWHDAMYVFGGYASGSGFRQDTFRFDFSTEVWTLLRPECGPEGMPAPRRKHAAAVVGDCMVIFGGTSGRYLNDLWVLMLSPPPVVLTATTATSTLGSSAVTNSSPGSTATSSSSTASAPGSTSVLTPIQPTTITTASTQSGTSTATAPQNEMQLALARDMLALLDSSELSDLTFIIEENQPGSSETRRIQLRAHKAIVHARCKSLSAIALNTGSINSGQLEVTITNTTAAAFTVLLHWIYTSSLQLPTTETQQLCAVADEVLSLSDRYQISPISADLPRLVMAQLSPQNCTAALLMADKHPQSCSELRAAALRCVAENYRDVVGTPEFRDLSRELLFEVMTEVAKPTSNH